MPRARSNPAASLRRGHHLARTAKHPQAEPVEALALPQHDFEFAAQRADEPADEVHG